VGAREDTLRDANTVIVNHHYGLELARKFGGRTMSSSDGQRFPARSKSLTGRDMIIRGGRVLSTDRWNEDLGAGCYPDLLRMGGSLKFGEATASLIVGKWSAASRQRCPQE
jgi:Tn3 transposase DDE domain